MPSDLDFQILARLVREDPGQFSQEREKLMQDAIRTSRFGPNARMCQMMIDADRFVYGPGIGASRHLLDLSLDSVQRLIEAFGEFRKLASEMPRFGGEIQLSAQIHPAHPKAQQ
ncbi:MAG TPA: hypothetical protein PKL28_09085 [Rhodocyclaceae bacterium]|jgi:hypothetical protein|nr:hypothetical protein [Rhodocyclaceae bacterium]HNM81199.1 hypothetical protein [Rhodocyclaceae bacterium]